MSSLLEDLQELRAKMADPSQVVIDRHHIMENAQGWPVDSDNALAARGCLCGNAWRVAERSDDRYTAMLVALDNHVVSIGKFMDGEDVVPDIDAAIARLEA